MAAWEPEKVRAALREFIAARKLTVHGWTKKSKLSESTLRNFLAGGSDSLTLRSLVKLADGADVELAELLLQSEDQRVASRLAADLEDIHRATWIMQGKWLLAQYGAAPDKQETPPTPPTQEAKTKAPRKANWTARPLKQPPLSRSQRSR